MQQRGFVGQRVVIVLAVLCAVSGIGWAVSAQAFASGANRGGVMSTTPPPPPANAPKSNAKAAPLVAATNAHCGQVIKASLTLNGDLDCSSYVGNALTVAGTSAVTLNLNGHVVVVNSSSFLWGIAVTGTSDIVENGTVTGGYIGVVVQGSKDTVTKIGQYGATYGIYDAGTATKVTNNQAVNDTADGIRSNGLGVTITGNRAAGNAYGIDIVAGTATVSGNAADDNTTAGIFVYITSGSVSSNSANFNAGYGIDNGLPASVDGGGNTAHGNWYASGGTANPQCKTITCS